MPSTGPAKADQQRWRRARETAERAAIRDERDQLRERVRELEERLKQLEGEELAVIRAEVDRRVALRKLAPLEKENTQLWNEVERLSSLAVPDGGLPALRRCSLDEVRDPLGRSAG